MPQSRVLSRPSGRPAEDVACDGGRPDPSEDLLEACRRAVSRVLAELPDWDRHVLEEHRTEVVEVTHRETRAALEEIRGVLDHVA
jgi:hypothetical protein